MKRDRPRVLLLAPTTAYQVDDFAAAAERLDVELVLGTDRCQVLARVWPEGALALDFRHPERALGVVAFQHGQRPFAGIVPTDERTSVLASLAARRLGLRANPVEAARAAGNKERARDTLTRAGLPQPRYRVLRFDDDAGAALAEAPLDFPVVIKPLALSASRGVMRADDLAELAERVERLRRLLAQPDVRALDPEAADRYLVEEYVPGAEVAFEGLLRDGQLSGLALFDKPDPLEGPVFAETLYVTPSRHPAALQERIRAATAAAAAALGLREGPVHAELRLPPAGPVVIEVAARSIGGLCNRALRFGAGISLEEVILAHAAGLSLPGADRAADPASGVLMLPVLEAGVLRAVDGVDAARAVPLIRDVVISARPGDLLVPLPEGRAYLGFVFATGPTPAAVEAALRDAWARLQVRVARPL